MKTFTFCFLTIVSFVTNLPAQDSKEGKLTFKLKQLFQDCELEYGKDSLRTAMCYDSLGLVTLGEKYYKFSKEYFTRALDIRLRRLGRKHTEVTTSYNNLALFHERINDYENAKNYYKKALRINSKYFGENHLNTAINYNNLAWVNYILNDHYKAKKYYNKELDVRLSHLDKKHLDISNSYHKLATVCMDLKDYEKAREYYKEALNIKLNNFGEYHLYNANSYHNLAIVHVKLMNYEKAKEYYEKTLYIVKSSNLDKYNLNIADAYHDLADICKKLKYRKKVKEYYEKAMNIKDKNYLSLANAKGENLVIDIIDIWLYVSDHLKTKKYCEKALKINLDNLGKDYMHLADNHRRLVDVYQALGKYRKANYHDMKAKYYKNCYFLGNETILEIEQLNNAYIVLSDTELVKYLNTTSKKYDKYYSLTTKNMDKHTIQNTVNLLLNTKGIALDYSISIRSLIHKINDKELTNLDKELRKINKHIADAELMSLEEQINNLIDINSMRNRRDTLAYQIRENGKFREYTNRTLMGWREIYNKLDTNEMVIDIVRFNHVYRYRGSLPPDDSTQHYAALISKNYPTPQFIRLSSEESISPLLQPNDNGQPNYIQNMLHRKELYEKIWQPLLPYLEGIKTVHISPAGLLHRVSFEALQDDKRQYLGEQFQFHYYSSIRDFIKKDSTNHSYKDAVLMGNILYDLEDISEYQIGEWYTMRDARGKVRRLEATLEEVTKINEICSGSTIESTLLMVDKATEEAVQYFSGERAPSILHFATHGLFLEPIDTSITGGTTKERMRSLPNPLQRSVLMLYGANHRWEKNEPAIGTDEDGILTALEVTALDLRKTDLVVLSACSTALGDVQHNTGGVFGLQRAFKLAGVNHSIKRKARTYHCSSQC